MQTFQEIDSGDSIQEVVKTAFNTNLELLGGWGYTKELATIIKASKDDSIAQIEFTLATMRAYLEMNMTLDEESRYGAINLAELSRESIDGYDKVTYEISAIKELVYKEFIDEYKENSENPNFDMADHFNRRKEATLKREVVHWFKVEG